MRLPRVCSHLVAPLVLATLVAGCSKKSQDGLPPAQDWQGGNTAPVGTVDKPAGGAAGGGMAAGGMANPHAGMDMSNPHAGMDMSGGDPHAGLDMSGGGGPDVTQMGLSSPDPNRTIDPTRRIKGVLKVDAKAKDKVKAGGAIFLIVKKAGADGQPSGPPLAVDKVMYQDNLAFELTEANAMVAGTELTGDVVVSARYDQDSDAISKQPGDVTGQARVKVPSDGVQLMLDTVLP